MKKIALALLCMLPYISVAQTEEYQTFIYTNDDLAFEIKQKLNERGDASRGIFDELLNAGLQAAKKITSGYASSLANLGTDVAKSIFMRNSLMKQQWEKMVLSENVYTTQINTVREINNFYKEISFDGALDPKGLCFDGIGCLRKDGNDTLFYISCHLDRSKIDRLINHSKFELTLDTLILSPMHSNLPNTSFDIPYSFDERKDFTLNMNIKITSSWMNEIVQLQKNQQLGEFNITIPVEQGSLDADGFLRYVRKANEASDYVVSGESYIVPRSYMGYRDADDNFRHSWGTGEYQLSIEIQETCDITDQYRDNWKQDFKRRKAQAPKEGFFSKCWHTITNQTWDDATKSWVITSKSTMSESSTKK